MEIYRSRLVTRRELLGVGLSGLGAILLPSFYGCGTDSAGGGGRSNDGDEGTGVPDLDTPNDILSNPYVDDLVDAIVLALNKQESKFELLNIGLGKAAAIKDLVQKIIDASGKSLNIEYDTTKPTIKTSLALDCTKAKTILGWQPKTSLEEGIRKTIEWYKANILRQ